MLSLVPESKLKYDPRKLPYLYPSMSAASYKKRTDEYYRLLTIKHLEEIAAMSEAVLLPSACVHHKRRNPQKRIQVFGRTYYLVQRDDLTPLEEAKYRIMCEEGRG